MMMSSKGKELFSYLPAYYSTSTVMGSMMDAQGDEIELLYEALNEIGAQFFVNSATWGLKRWEMELGIATDVTKPLEQRRALVESKLRGAGSFTGRLVKNVSEAYDGGTVDVTFHPAAWTFTVKFVDTMGIPPNLEALQMVIEEIKPAHLAVEYEFSYLLIRDIHEKMTLAQMEQTLLHKFAGGTLLPRQRVE